MEKASRSIRFEPGAGDYPTRAGHPPPPPTLPPPQLPFRRRRGAHFQNDSEEDDEETSDIMRGYSALSRDETTEDTLDHLHLKMQDQSVIADGPRMEDDESKHGRRRNLQRQNREKLPLDTPPGYDRTPIEPILSDCESEDTGSFESSEALSSRASYRDVPIPNYPTSSRSRDIDMKLWDELAALRAENDVLRKGGDPPSRPITVTNVPYRIQVFYKVGNTLYLDEPHYEQQPGSGAVLCANVPIRNEDRYLSQHPEVAFSIYKEYHKRSRKSPTNIETKDGVFRTPKPDSEHISLTARDMQHAIDEFIEQVPYFYQYFPNFDSRRILRSPYIFMFFSAHLLQEILPGLSTTSQTLIQLFDSTIQQSHGREYENVRREAEKGMVSRDRMMYLVRPGDVLIEGSYSENSKAWISTSWLEFHGEIDKETQSEEWRSARKKRTPMRSATAVSEIVGHEKVITYGWYVNAWSWNYDGVFEKQYKTHRIYMWNTRQDEAVKITSLSIYPLRHAPARVRVSLEQRGKMFWSLRHRRFISYLRKEDDELHDIEDRYVVDTNTYKRLFPESKVARLHLQSSISTSEMTSDDPPSGDALLVFPPTIMAYNMPSKVWSQLYVDRITEISWNKQAFKDLVAEAETKELVQALVTKQLRSNVSTDFVAGKGNGLIMLLHGAPGTGKTFTAEGVAEFAEKPLLRVTCGDVGTEAEVVDQRLQGTFKLGRIWDCVVLLDEADVFLEDRDMRDLNRNALVSVFLRALEYYDGILILTSNRVGTFDEAFKSRIQLSLHYENLGPVQRRKIWRNFMNRIKTLEVEEGDTTTDVEDILDHIDMLSAEPMNGREIRNAITIARQLAQFKNERFCYSHLQHVIRVGGKFGKYLADLREGLTDDDIKKESQLRLSYTLDGK